jgi:hypothetical protein
MFFLCEWDSNKQNRDNFLSTQIIKIARNRQIKTATWREFKAVTTDVLGKFK